MDVEIGSSLIYLQRCTRIHSAYESTDMFSNSKNESKMSYKDGCGSGIEREQAVLASACMKRITRECAALHPNPLKPRSWQPAHTALCRRQWTAASEPCNATHRCHFRRHRCTSVATDVLPSPPMYFRHTEPANPVAVMVAVSPHGRRATARSDDGHGRS
jgi:hypothetical protein